MAHDFEIKRNKNEESAYFFGYAQGIFYRVFAAGAFNAGVSGSNEGKTISQPEAETGLKTALNSEAIRNYPDKNRSHALTEFLENQVLAADKNETFYVHFS